MAKKRKKKTKEKLPTGYNKQITEFNVHLRAGKEVK